MHIIRFIAAIPVLAILLVTQGLCLSPPVRDCFPGSSKHSFVFGPEYHFDEHLLEFFNPKNDFFKNRYFLENSLSLEAAFFSVNQRSFFFGQVILNFDMGRQVGAILLDPNEVDMGFGPLFEYRTKLASVQAGLDHHCFHQIDKSEWNTLYWNKLFIGAGSPGMREGVYREQLRFKEDANWRQRLSWQASYGYFVHHFFGLLDTNALSWGNAYIHEILLSARWAFLRGPSYAVFATGQSRTRIDRGGRWLWTENMGCEASTLKGEFGLSMYINWNISDQSIERENRDKLVEAGFRVYR